MRPEKEHLFRDLLEDGDQEARREVTLSAGGRILRRRRSQRVVSRYLALAGVVVLATLGIHKATAPRQPGSGPRPATLATSSPRFQVRFLSDDELLDLFPGTPVGLATIGEKKRLIFPRPGDEARFVSRAAEMWRQ